MSRGKYKRKRERAKQKAENKAEQARFMAEKIIASKNPTNICTGHEKQSEEHAKPLISSKSEKTKWTDKVVACFTVVLALASIYQFYIMSGQLGAMQLDQRAWLQLIFEATPLKADSEIVGILHIENTGKTPAHDIDGDVVVQLLANDGIPTPTDYRPAHVHISSGILFPDTKNDDAKIPRMQFPRFENVTIIGKTQAQKWVFDQTEVNEFNSALTYIVIYGRFTYRDSSGEHWTQFCSVDTFPTPSRMLHTKGCYAYNNTDDDTQKNPQMPIGFYMYLAKVYGF